MTELVELLAGAEALLSEAARIDRALLGDDELIAVMKADERVGRFVDASRVMDAGEVADRSRYELGAAGLSMRLSERKPNNFIERITMVSQSEVSRRVRIGLAIRGRQSMLGEALPPERPIVAEAMTNGLIGIDAASTILYSLKQAASGSDATPERMDEAELALVQMGTKESADLVADAGRLWRDLLDPDGVEPRYEDIRERQMVTVGRERNGIKNYNIKAAPVLSALLDAVFVDSMDPKVGPRFISEEDLARAPRLIEIRDGQEVEIIIDPRPLERKRADILEGVLTAALRETRDGPTNMRTVGSVTAIISLKALESGKGFGIIEGVDEVIPASVIQEIACDSGFYPVVLGTRGESLFHGMRKRYATQAQRRAIIARDGDRCIVPGCKGGGARTNVHHVIFNVNGGPTDVDNLVLLCPGDHHGLHQGAFELKMVNGMPYYRASVNKNDEYGWQPVSRNRLSLASV